MSQKTQPTSIERRRFLNFTWRTVGASIALSLLPGENLFARNRPGKNPFTLGVASGDPTPDGIVLWTRLAPEPADLTALGSHAVPVGWRIADDESMRRVIKRGVALAPAELAHSVHVDVEGL